MTQSLFGPTPTITFADEAEATYDMALRVLFDKAGLIVWIRFFGTTNAISTEPFAAVYETNGTLRYSETFGPGAGLLTAAWNQLSLATPVAVAAGETLDITVGPRNRYAGTSGIFPLDNGADLSASGSFFKASVALEHPDTSSAAWFGIDVGFDAEIDGEFVATAPAAVLAGTAQLRNSGLFTGAVPGSSLAGTGRLVNLGAGSLALSGFTLTGTARLVNSGTFQGAAAVPILSSTSVIQEPGIATPGGTTAAPAAGGTTAVPIASGRP